MEVGLVTKIDIDHEMQQAYLDYAMSVIVARALPDARDGLKPVHRRILYAMHDMGIRPDSPYKKSARIVGEVLGKYHPHGDAAVYDAMARMAQDFSMRYLLVDGQGNFGSMDGDPPAAMRYTEARLSTAAGQMLADIQKNTVDFEPNFDGSLDQPTVLPSALPNLLVNGATGIAVGMATSIPPHNLNEIVEGMHYLLENWDKLDDIGIEELLRFVQGPDFPTGGLLVQSADGDGLASAYSTGRGQVTIQARVHLEEMERGRSRIIVTELPYMTNKSSLIERIADLAREEKLEGIADLRDESDRQGMRIVIELSKTANPEAVLKDLLRHTPMQTTFSIIMLALVDGEPRTLSLKQAMRAFLEHRLEIVRRRSQFDLERAQARAHILEGLRVALKNLDEVIEIIRKSPDVEAARARLMKRFKLSDIQTQAILDMPLRRLAALERKKIDEEYKETQALIKELEGLLRSPKKMRQVVGDELTAVKQQYGDRRRTHMVQLKAGQTTASLLTAVETVPDKTAWLSVTAEGRIARSLSDGLPPLSGPAAPAWLVRVSSRDTLYLVSEGGEAAALPMHAVPETDHPADGAPLDKVSALREGARLAAVFSAPPRNGRNGDEPADAAASDEPRFILTITRQGMLKKSALAELPGPSASLFTLAKVNEGDRLGWVGITSGQNEVLLATARGMAIRFKEDEIRPMGLAAAGVMGIKLAAGDELIGAEVLPKAGDLLLVSVAGKGKRVALDQFPVQGRYGQGVQAWKPAAGERLAAALVGGKTAEMAAHVETGEPVALRMDAAPLQNRAATGRTVLKLPAGEQLRRLTLPWTPPFRANDTEAAVERRPQTADDEKAPVKATAAKKVTAKDGKPATAAKKPAAAAKTAAAKTATSKKAATAGGEKQASAKAAGKTTATRKAAPKKDAAPTQAAGKATTAKKAAPASKATAAKESAAKAPAKKTAGGGKPAPAKATQTSTAKKPATASDGKTAAKSATKAPASKASKTSEAKPATQPTAKTPTAKTVAKPARKTAGKQPATSGKTAAKKPASGKKPVQGTLPNMDDKES